jgi:hypothetical protein
MVSDSYQLSIDLFDSSSDHEEYLMASNVVEMTSGQSDCAARLLTTAKLYLNSLPEPPIGWEQMNQNLNNYRSNPTENCSTFWILDFTDRGDLQEEMH